MIQIQGIETTFDFSKLKKCSDLIWLDGPLLSHYEAETGDHFMYYWVDADDEYNRWMLIRTNIGTLRDYVSKKISLKTLIENPEDGIVWVADVDVDLKFHNTTMISVSSLPLDYLPAEDSYYEFNCEDEYLTTNDQTYSLSIPDSDKSLFSSIIERMGWTLHNKLGRVAVL